jgi:hypothetical protein
MGSRRPLVSAPKISATPVEFGLRFGTAKVLTEVGGASGASRSRQRHHRAWHGEEAQAQLETNVVPLVKQAPGVVAGYWMRSSDGLHGSSVLLFENEETARAAADMIPNTPRPDFVTIDSIEVREVVAQV